MNNEDTNRRFEPGSEDCRSAREHGALPYGCNSAATTQRVQDEPCLTDTAEIAASSVLGGRFRGAGGK
jgi:hypothetical protein